MSWRLVRTSRLPRWPWWAVGLGAAWAALVAAATALSRVRGVPVSLCLFKRLTTVPCPTCGGGRGVLRLLAGHPLAAWGLNPLLFTVLAVATAALVLRVVFARAVRVELSPRGRRIAWIVAGILLLANWAYVIARVG